MGSKPDLDDFEFKNKNIAKITLCICTVIQIYFALAIASQLIG